MEVDDLVVVGVSLSESPVLSASAPLVVAVPVPVATLVALPETSAVPFGLVEVLKPVLADPDPSPLERVVLSPLVPVEMTVLLPLSLSFEMVEEPPLPELMVLVPSSEGRRVVLGPITVESPV